MQIEKVLPIVFFHRSFLNQKIDWQTCSMQNQKSLTARRFVLGLPNLGSRLFLIWPHFISMTSNDFKWPQFSWITSMASNELFDIIDLTWLQMTSNYISDFKWPQWPICHMSPDIQIKPLNSLKWPQNITK